MLVAIGVVDVSTQLLHCLGPQGSIEERHVALLGPFFHRPRAMALLVCSGQPLPTPSLLLVAVGIQHSSKLLKCAKHLFASNL
jgi:hypothetical protein